VKAATAGRCQRCGTDAVKGQEGYEDGIERATMSELREVEEWTLDEGGDVEDHSLVGFMGAKWSVS